MNVNSRKKIIKYIVYMIMCFLQIGITETVYFTV
nr:MAG TPA_asm: hypothetical protein [Bacteriophage sp.]